MFGDFIRAKREAMPCSLRQVANSVSVTPSYLSKVERGLVAPPSERTILGLARVLEEDGDVLLAKAGKVAEDLQGIIMSNPKFYADLLRSRKEITDECN